MSATAKGTFTVKLAPQPHVDGVGDAAIGRLSIDKSFEGDLVATSLGQMIAFRSSVEGSANYSAIEKVSGALAGRKGTFVLQHTGVMNRGAASLLITVAPDSGTDALVGLTGKMNITIVEKQHSYEFEYELPDV